MGREQFLAGPQGGYQHPSPFDFTARGGRWASIRFTASSGDRRDLHGQVYPCATLPAMSPFEELSAGMLPSHRRIWSTVPASRSAR